MVYYIFTAMLLVIIAILLLYKFKILKDDDNDFIPDEVEDLYEKFQADVKTRVENMKDEAEDVKDAASNLVKQTGDVFDAAAGKKNNS